MRKYLSAGLAILLPAIFTFLIVAFLVNLLTKPFLSITQTLVVNSGLISETLVLIVSKCLILIVIISVITLIGLIGKLFLIDILFKVGDHLFHRLPFINRIYKATQEIVHSLFSPNSKSFTDVVLVPFPSAGNLCLGLVTKDSLTVHLDDSTKEETVPVFVPGTPNPSVGFLLMYKKHELVFLNMSIEDALKFVVSCAVVTPNFELKHSNINKSTYETNN